MGKRRQLENIVLRGTAAKGLQLVFTFIFRIALVPLFLVQWGAEKYGVWLTVFSLYNLLMALDYGHGNYISNEINNYYHTDRERAQKILGSAVIVAFLSGFIELLIVLILFWTGALNMLFANDTEPLGNLVWGISALILFRMLFGSVKGIVLRTVYPSGQIDKAMHVGTVETIGLMAVLLLGALLNLTVAEVCFVLAGSKAVIAVTTLILVRRWEPLMFPWWRGADIRFGLANFGKSLVLVFNQFLEKFISDGINLIVSGAMGAVVLPVFHHNENHRQFRDPGNQTDRCATCNLSLRDFTPPVNLGS